MNERKKKAYKCDTKYSEHQEIVFAYTAADAKKMASDVWDGCDFIDRRVTRAPEFDNARQPTPTMSEYLAGGWWMECSNCSTHVTGDGAEAYDDEERGEPVIDDARGLVWCDKRCQDNDKWYQAILSKKANA